MTTDASPLPAPDAAPTEPMRASVLSALGVLVPALLHRDGDGLTVQDAASGAYLHADASVLAWLGHEGGNIVGRSDAELFEPAVVAALRAAEQTALAQSGPVVSEHKFEMRGVRREFSVLRQRLDGGRDGAPMLAAVWRDLAPQRRHEALRAAAIEQLEQQQRANEQLRREMHDHTLRDRETGLYNRAHFEDQLRREVDLSTREHREFALVSIELDPLAPDVAALGGAASSRVYEAMGRLLRGNTRAMDASCRCDDTPLRVVALGRRAGHRAFAHGRPAPPMRDPDRRPRGPQYRLHGLDGCGQLSAHRAQPRRVARGLQRGAGRRAPARRQPRDPGQHPLRPALGPGNRRTRRAVAPRVTWCDQA